MNHMKFESPDLTAQNIDRIAALFPNCITEMLDEEHSTPEKKVYKRAVNFELLKQMLSPDVVDGDEAYEFTWVGKKEAIVEANKPIRKTLRPCVAESKDWDTTENLYIEGDNLEVLKLLQESYLGKVKMIYIDPPYNTGNDFIYADDFMRSQEEENAQMGMYDEDENRLFKNTDTNGRFHSDWCSMIYSRLMLARNLLTEDGAIFISIDDRECDNLIKICDEVFGESNFVGNISWQKTYSPRNDSKGIPAEKECIIVYGRQASWTPKKLPRTEEMDSKYKNPDNDIMPWTSDNPCAPGAKSHQGMVYAIQHPFTGELLYPATSSCWRYEQQTMLDYMQGWCAYELKSLNDAEKRAEICGIDVKDIRQDVKGIVLKHDLEQSQAEAEKVLLRGQWPRFYFTKNGHGGIRRKTYLDNVDGRMVTNLWPYSEVGHTDEAKKELKSLFNGEIPFDTPKPVRLIQRMVQISTEANDIVLDFFSGTATTAQAVMQRNAEDGGHRKFILVQIPENVNSKWMNICEIGKERIRRAGEKIKSEIDVVHKDDYAALVQSQQSNDQKVMTGFDSLKSSGVLTEKGYTYKDKDTKDISRITYSAENPNDFYRFHPNALDVGFRVLKLDDSNMKDVYYAPDDYDQGMLAGLESNIKDDRTDLDLLFGCLIDWGLPLSLPYKSEKIDGCTVHTYNDGDLIACFDANIPESVVKEIAQRKPLRAVFRDSGFASSPEKINVFEIFKLYMPEDAGDISKRVRVI